MGAGSHISPYAEYSSSGSGHLYLIVCQVIYREPGIDSDVLCYCAPSMGTYATRPPPPPSPHLPSLGTRFSSRESISQSVASPEDRKYSLMEGQGLIIQSKGHIRG